MKSTKESYELTYKTMRNGDQVCKDIANLANSQKKSILNKSVCKPNHLKTESEVIEIEK